MSDNNIEAAVFMNIGNSYKTPQSLIAISRVCEKSPKSPQKKTGFD